MPKMSGIVKIVRVDLTALAWCQQSILTHLIFSQITPFIALLNLSHCPWCTRLAAHHLGRWPIPTWYFLHLIADNFWSIGIYSNFTLWFQSYLNQNSISLSQAFFFFRCISIDPLSFHPCILVRQRWSGGLNFPRISTTWRAKKWEIWCPISEWFCLL